MHPLEVNSKAAANSKGSIKDLSRQSGILRSHKSQSSLKSLSTWGVIRGWDNAVNKMDACFSNMLYDLQKDEIMKREE